MRFHFIDIILFGNLFCILLSNVVSGYNQLALFFNLCVLLVIGRFVALPKVFLIFILCIFLAFLNTLQYNQILNLFLFANIVTATMLQVLCIPVAMSSLIPGNHEVYQKFQRFLTIVVVLIIADAAFTFIVMGIPFKSGEGFATSVFTNPQTKYFILLALPFLFMSGRRNLLLVLLLLGFIFSGQRGAMLAVLVVVFIYFLRVFLNKLNLVNLIYFLLVLGFFLLVLLAASSILEVDLFSPTSAVSRIVKWSIYLKLWSENIAGLLPYSAFYIFREGGIHYNIIEQFNYLEIITGEENFRHRAKIIQSTNKVGSEESLHLSYLLSYGVFYLALVLHLLVIIVIDFHNKFLKPGYSYFSTIFLSLIVFYVYGLTISAHKSTFFFTFIYFFYLSLRKKVSENESKPFVKR